MELLQFFFLYFIGLQLNNMFFSVGAALHNLGQFYFVLRKLEQAHKCYEVSQPAFLFSFFPQKIGAYFSTCIG